MMFSQPDTIVSSPYSSMGYNRYAYVDNNPVNFNDPSGHMLDDGCRTQGCGDATIYGGIVTLLTLANKSDDAISPARKAFYQQRAYEETIDLFQLGQPDYKSARVTVILGGTDPGDIEGVPPNPGSVEDENGIITLRIYDSAFASTPGDLAATISHENCHINQITGDACMPNSDAERVRNYPALSMGGVLNEIEANMYVLSIIGQLAPNTANGITEDNINDIETRLAKQEDTYPSNRQFNNLWKNKTFYLQSDEGY
jgi:hypothetical protein